MSWNQFTSLPHIMRLPLAEQIREYDIYNQTLIQEVLLQQQYYNQLVVVPNTAGGGIDEVAVVEEEFPGGGSGTIVFNGTNQYFTALNSDVVNWLPGTGDYTIEFFIKNGTQSVGAPRVFSLGFDTGATIGASIEGGKVYVWPYGNSLNGNYTAGYGNGSAWMHVAICRYDSATTLYINGVGKMTIATDTLDMADSLNPGFDLNVGVDNPDAANPNWWAGNLTNFRWDNTGLYNGDFTPPTSPLTATATTKLLMLGGGASNPVYDATKTNNLVNNGAQWSAESPFV